MLGGQDAGQLVGGSLVSALAHHARALLRRREGGQNIGGRTVQTDGALVDQGVILQGLVGHSDQRLAVALERAAHGQVPPRHTLSGSSDFPTRFAWEIQTLFVS